MDPVHVIVYIRKSLEGKKTIPSATVELLTKPGDVGIISLVQYVTAKGKIMEKIR